MRRGPITKQGSKLVRWAAIEAAQTTRAATRGSTPNGNASPSDATAAPIAKTAIARKLITLIYYGLRDGEIRCLKRRASRSTASNPARSPIRLRTRWFVMTPITGDGRPLDCVHLTGCRTTPCPTTPGRRDDRHPGTPGETPCKAQLATAPRTTHPPRPRTTAAARRPSRALHNGLAYGETPLTSPAPSEMTTEDSEPPFGAWSGGFSSTFPTTAPVRGGDMGHQTLMPETTIWTRRLRQKRKFVFRRLGQQ